MDNSTRVEVTGGDGGGAKKSSTSCLGQPRGVAGYRESQARQEENCQSQRRVLRVDEGRGKGGKKLRDNIRGGKWEWKGKGRREEVEVRERTEYMSVSFTAATLPTPKNIHSSYILSTFPFSFRCYLLTQFCINITSFFTTYTNNNRYPSMVQGLLNFFSPLAYFPLHHQPSLPSYIPLFIRILPSSSSFSYSASHVAFP